MENKHTPGPWTANSNQVMQTENWLQVADSFCSSSYRHITTEQMEANARLIAAAPELLEALRFARLRIWFLEQYTSGKCDPTNMDKINAAIDKATLTPKTA